MPPKHIGIVACSAEGAALCYRTICLEASEQMGEDLHPEISMHTHPLGQYMIPIRHGDWEKVAELMLDSTAKVAKSGAEFVICPDNTIHQAFLLVEKESTLPWLHIARIVSGKALGKGYHKIGVLGTKYLMEGPVYARTLEEYGFEHCIPSVTDRIKINEVIFAELVKGIILDKSRLYFNQVIQDLKNDGCDAVVLGCTEIPLIVNEEDCPLPILDSTRLLARAAIKYAIGDKI
jgi:aspartate racemase